MEYLNDLNEKQREAALHKDGPLLILAGAGSGKTSTMTRRIAYLIKEENVSPYNILAVTFTNKAAGEMRERVEALVGAGTPIWIQTFHSTCLRILRRYADRLGYDNNFVVYDTADQKAAIKNCLKKLNLDEKKYAPNYVLSVISDKKEKGISPKEYLEHAESNFREKELADLYSLYSTLLRKNNAMDFDDLILNGVKLFENNEDILEEYREKFKYIMVDEYQDTNYLQYRLVYMLAEKHRNICVVGDDDQCIYQWRGANIENILGFEKDFKGTKVVKLEQNYRSYGNILEAAHSLVENNVQRKNKKLWTNKDRGEKIQYHLSLDEKDEARYVVENIEKLKEKGYQYKDFAILYRTNVQSRNFEEAFTPKGIPYRVLGGLRYYDRKEIKDIMAYMRVVQNQADDLALVRIINEPKRGIGEKTLEKVRLIAEKNGESLFATLLKEDTLEILSSKPREKVSQMIHKIKAISDEKDSIDVSEVYQRVLDDTGYLKALEEAGTFEAEGRIENIMEFKSVIYDYEKNEPNMTLAEFMEKITLMAEVDNHDENDDSVVLMTMHSAKGLEFPVVFLVGLEDGLFPSWRSKDSVSNMEEERRLCYVGMTRAKEKLFLTGAEKRTVFGKTDFQKESVFIGEIDKSLMETSKSEKKEILQNENRNKGAGWRKDGSMYSNPHNPFSAVYNGKKSGKLVDHDGGSRSNKEFSQGDKVVHPKFGEGLVLESSGKVVSIMFDSQGVKKLAKDIAPIKKI